MLVSWANGLRHCNKFGASAPFPSGGPCPLQQPRTPVIMGTSCSSFDGHGKSPKIVFHTRPCWNNKYTSQGYAGWKSRLVRRMALSNQACRTQASGTRNTSTLYAHAPARHDSCRVRSSGARRNGEQTERPIPTFRPNLSAVVLICLESSRPQPPSSRGGRRQLDRLVSRRRRV